MRLPKRRRYLIEKNFQLRFIALFVVISLTGMAASAGVFGYLSAVEIEGIRWKTHNTGIEGAVTPYLLYISFFAVLFTSGVLFVVSRYVLDSIAGPVYRMKKDIEAVCEGNLNIRIRLRKKDAFRETADELDRMVLSMRERFGSISGHFVNIRKMVEDFEGAGGPSHVRCKRLSRRLEALAEELNKNFKV